MEKGQVKIYRQFHLCCVAFGGQISAVIEPGEKPEAPWTNLW